MTQEIRHIWGVEHKVRYNRANQIGVYFTSDAGATGVSVIPDMLPTHMAAAYGVDMSKANAPDTILDLILHQAHIPNPLDEANWESDVAARAGMRKRIVNHSDFPPGTVVPVTLYTAETDEEAMKAHTMRIKEVKTRIQYVPYTDVDPKTLRQSAAQMFHVTRDVEGTEPENPLALFRACVAVTRTGLDDQMRAIKQARLWTHGREPDASLRTRSRLGPTPVDVRPKNDALARKALTAASSTRMEDTSA